MEDGKQSLGSRWLQSAYIDPIKQLVSIRIIPFLEDMIEKHPGATCVKVSNIATDTRLNQSMAEALYCVDEELLNKELYQHGIVARLDFNALTNEFVARLMPIK